MEHAPRILKISEVGAAEVGGKAAGLADLHQMGLSVPGAFVILDAREAEFPEDLEEHYAALGSGAVAVRSSAIGEDGQDASFAGQYATELNVRGVEGLRRAIGVCVRSLSSAAVDAYHDEQADGGSGRMCVVVQRMVEAATAGVLFTADPVSGRHDRLVIDAVRGLGESLVSGDVTPDHYVLAPDNAVLRVDLAGSEQLLQGAEIEALATGARAAVAQRGYPLDMEWAIDATGELHWLQARPITTLGVDLDDGFTPIPADQVVTRCNVGEMMPGPVCPLTFSTQGRAIEHGMQHMLVNYGGRPAITQEWTQINLFFGHMFINMTGGLEGARWVSLTSAERIGQALCGRPVPELQEPANPKSLPRRWWGSLQFIRYCLRATRVIAEFDSRFRHFHVRYRDNSMDMVKEMENQFGWLLEADEVHLRSSAYSGVMEGVIQGVVEREPSDGTPEAASAQQAEAARLLAGASYVESAMMVSHLDEVVDEIATDPEAAAHFRSLAPEDGLAWLRSEASGAVGINFDRFLHHHGHRGYRELCVREKAWADEPEQVVRTMQASVLARLAGNYEAKTVAPIDLAELPRALRFLLPRAHLAIRQREQTKSMLVDATYRLKCGYRHLGVLLAREGHLPDEDLVFFFSRDELSAFCRAPTAEEALRAEHRRRALDFQSKLEFQDVYVGRAAPVDPEPVEASGDGQYVGRPVSRGVVEGVARVALSLEEAAALQPGEILISHITDIGWTPYFSLIAGLATDVGSAVSHGAVIAREYGLPAIVNLRVATKVIKTGDRVRLDADAGILTLLQGESQ
ncbi:MAG TPA: pyruvate, water dikinase [Deltaproteobacteria bacterium]|nr:pyruvate, water dikinase [Deltaproteobacteria bacterium]